MGGSCSVARCVFTLVVRCSGMVVLQDSWIKNAVTGLDIDVDFLSELVTLRARQLFFSPVFFHQMRRELGSIVGL